jgi:putative tryptophan/tyrosine transport system substrate-binding protein
MRRRQFVALLAGSALSLPLTAWAQRSTKVHRIAMLHPTHPVAELTETSSIYYYRAFFDELRRLGYIEGQNLTIERYSAEGHTENYLALARSVATRNPDVVYTVGPQMAKYLQGPRQCQSFWLRVIRLQTVSHKVWRGRAAIPLASA